MDFRHRAAFAFLALVAFSGCRHNQAARELLERELRMQEDRIYQLEAELESARRDLDHTSGRPFSRSPLSSDCPPFQSTTILESSPSVVEPSPVLRSPPQNQPSPTTSNSKPPIVAPPANSEITPPTIELPPQTSLGKEQAPPYQGPPTISPPSPDVPEGLPGKRGSTITPAPMPTLPKEPLPTTPPNIPPPFKTMSSPKFLPPSTKPQRLDVPATSELTPTDSAALPLDEDRRVKSITLSRTTRGVNLDGKPGDDGILVVVEPRNAKGEVVPTSGATSIVLLDPAMPDEAARYARWDFAGDDAGPLYRTASNGSGAGFHFEMPWPENPPAHARLKLFVRFTTEGRQLQVDRDLVVDMGDSAAGVWLNPNAAPAGAVVTTAAARKPSDVKPAASTELNWGVPKRTPAVLPAFTAEGAQSIVPPEPMPIETSGPALIPAAP